MCSSQQGKHPSSSPVVEPADLTLVISLKGIYEKLCKSRRKSSVGATPTKSCEDCKMGFTNCYGMLESHPEKNSVLGQPASFEHGQQNIGSAPLPHVSKIERGSPRIANDDLGEAIEILGCLQVS